MNINQIGYQQLGSEAAPTQGESTNFTKESPGTVSHGSMAGKAVQFLSSVATAAHRQLTEASYKSVESTDSSSGYESSDDEFNPKKPWLGDFNVSPELKKSLLENQIPPHGLKEEQEEKR